MLSTDRRRLRHGWVLVPFVTGKTAEEAVEALKSAGLTGPADLVGLTSGGSWIDGPPGRVTATAPRSGLVVKPDSRIKVYVNAGATSPLSADERAVIEQVRDSNRQEFEAQERIFRDRPTPTPNEEARAGVSVSVILDAALLDRLEDTLRGGGALVADALAPGLTDTQIDELLIPAGIDLPEEARAWWRWQDGARRDSPRLAWSLGHRDLLSLDVVVEIYELERAAVVELYGLDGLLGPVGEKPRIYFDCTGPRDQPVAIFSQNDIETPEVLMGSIGDLVTGWLELLNRHAWTIGPDGTVEVHHDKVPAHLAPIA